MSDTDSGTMTPSGGNAQAAEGASAPQSASTPPSDVGPPQTAGAEASPAPSHDPFDGMDSNDYYDSIEIGPEPDSGTGADEPGPAAPAQVAGAEGEPKAPAAPAPTSVQPQVAPAPPTAPATPTENVQQSGRSQLEQALEGLKQNQTQLADWAAREMFQLSEADAAKYETDPGALIPQLMGRVYTQAVQSAVNLIKNLVPEMVNSGITTQQTRAQRATEALNEFYQANPHLSADQHGAAVDRWAKSFRSMNPGASRAEAIAFVGRAVSAEFGIWPSANGTGSPAAGRRPAPFSPARQGGRAPATQKGPHDPYAGMEDDYD